MKKLLTACAVAGLSAAVFGDVTSANVVGYMGQADGAKKHIGVGVVFTPVSGDADTFCLKDVTVKSSVAGKFMNPASEYLQHLAANTSVDGCYTYVSEDWLRNAAFKSTAWDDKYLTAIGWWKWVKSTNYKGLIQSGDYTLKCTDAEMTFPRGTAFLANTSGTSALTYTSSGAVLTQPTYIDANGNGHPYFVNYLPVSIDINQIEVKSTVATKFMNPASEYLQVLSPDNTSVTACYTYVSEDWLRNAAFKSTAWDDKYLTAIGWWKWVKSTNYKGLIQSGDYTLKLSALEVKPGDSFLGNLSTTSALRFNFPAAVEIK